MSFVPFKNHRMPVGRRRKDWLLVSYAPLIDPADPDPDGTVPSLFFTATGDEEERPPMQGEVMFFPHFAVETCESSKPKEREVLQMQFLLRCWTYLNEQDPEKVKALENDWDEPNWRKWQSWLDEAKVWKGKQMRGKISRMKKKKQAQDMRDAGISQEEIDRTLDSDDDSGVEVEIPEVRMHSRKKAPGGRSNMGPPGKRPNANGDNNSRSKKRREASPQSDAGEFRMSGGLPNDNAWARANRGGSLLGRRINDLREESLDFDPAPPPEPNFFGSHNGTRRNSTSQNDSGGLFVTPAVPSDAELERMAGLSGMSIEEVRALHVDGFDAAQVAQVMRESQQPEARYQATVEDDDDGDGFDAAHMREATRASLQPEARPAENIVETTEGGSGTGRAAKRRGSGRGSGSGSGSGA